MTELVTTSIPDAPNQVWCFRVEGTPRAWRRPRFNRRTGAVFNASQDTAWRESIWGQTYANRPLMPLTGPIELRLTFVFAFPKSWPKSKRVKAASGGWGVTRRPDLDNLFKAVCDALQGTYFEDDAQIVRVCASKVWGERAGMIGEVEALESMERKAV